MDLTREDALTLFRMMWTDMQNELGDNPDYDQRIDYKEKWINERFPYKRVRHDCFLCEYAISKEGVHTNVCSAVCAYCPLKWTAKHISNTCEGYDYFNTLHNYDWRYSPISEILALPEREDV